MATSKPPVGTDKSPRDNNTDSLGDSINKLDHLIKSSDTEYPAQRNIQIPVLDDIVEAEDPELKIAQQTSMNAITPQQLTELVDDIEVKLTEELDALVDLLKDTIKDNIMDEIKTQLNAGFMKNIHDKED